MKTKTWKAVRETRLTPETSKRVTARAQAELQALTLRELRQELETTPRRGGACLAGVAAAARAYEARADLRVQSTERPFRCELRFHTA